MRHACGAVCPVVYSRVRCKHTWPWFRLIESMHVAEAFQVPPELGNPKLNISNSSWTKVERRVHFNCYVCGINLLIRTLEHPSSFWFGSTSPDCIFLVLSASERTVRTIKS
jgi:hypothetical protein